MGEAKNLIGRKFGRLEVVGDAGIRGRKHMWFCLCECGAERRVQGGSLKSGETGSCGCLQRERSVSANTTHGMTDSPEYRSWCSMLTRCTNRASPNYHNYGGRGITVCERWYNFKNFFSDMGHMPAGQTLERINNEGPYCPENCRWASMAEQRRNKRTNRWITHDGQTLCLADWERRQGLVRGRLGRRLMAGWSPVRALGPVQTAPAGRSS